MGGNIWKIKLFTVLLFKSLTIELKKKPPFGT